MTQPRDARGRFVKAEYGKIGSIEPVWVTFLQVVEPNATLQPERSPDPTAVDQRAFKAWVEALPSMNDDIRAQWPGIEHSIERLKPRRRWWWPFGRK
jgi:hypothetical protein